MTIQELTIIEPEFKVQKFNPTQAELTKKANEYRELLNTEIATKEDFDILSEARKDCKATRVEITKIGKSIRDEANKFAKEVINQEKALIAIIEPLELELEAKEEAYKKKLDAEKRKKRYPEFAEKFKAIGYDLTEAEYCNSDDAKIHALFTRIQQEALDKQRLEFEAKQAEQRAKEEALQAQARELERQQQAIENEKAIKLAAEKAALEAQAEAERKHKLEIEELKLANERKLKEQQEAAAKEAVKKKMQEELEAANKVRELKAKEAEESFIAWKKKIGFVDGVDLMRFDEVNQLHAAYKFLDTYEPGLNTWAEQPMKMFNIKEQQKELFNEKEIVI